MFHLLPACPFCGSECPSILPVRYSTTAEYNPDIADFEGSIRSCADCGIAYSDIGFDSAAFATLYAKSLDNLSYFDDTILQKARRSMMAGAIRRQRSGPMSKALHVPLHSRIPPRMLDVGCGFGEFTEAYASLGAKATGTEVIPALVERCRRRNIECLSGDLTEIDLPGKYDLILFRAVLYRTADPAATLVAARDALAEGGEISIVDPCVDQAGINFFAHKQFPQGRYYITDFARYADMLASRFGLRAVSFRQAHGRPDAALKTVRFWGNIMGFCELVVGNVLRLRPYMGAYLLRRA